MDGYFLEFLLGLHLYFFTLVNELQKQSISEQEAFKLVFRDFWIEKSTRNNEKLLKRRSILILKHFIKDLVNTAEGLGRFCLLYCKIN